MMLNIHKTYLESLFLFMINLPNPHISSFYNAHNFDCDHIIFNVLMFNVLHVL
jgi:hypothetical protein